MVVQNKVDEVSLSKLNQFDCQEYLSHLRQSLGQAQKKAVMNEMRRTIHIIENRLRKLNESR
ncbi:hypothetical protein [Adhaeribacter rhizoryzae]|uniref:Uncharacterized protein n=1 Tax=Adhaeribacter rhizoryzae TaxID=2607907 RepID=A0A5M6DR79_9BACT|nr:hypothetical protein [Adhaeribacter rhizoryzae]KAA5548762.1 hypothetical protein F0145_04420 [Adhaeribacter rhizoryzae]